MKRTFHDGCHRGVVRFECELDRAESTTPMPLLGLAKSPFWKAIAKAGAFRLLHGEEALSVYRFAGQSIRHVFRSRRGVKPFGQGHLYMLGGTFYAVNIACPDDAMPDQSCATTDALCREHAAKDPRTQTGGDRWNSRKSSRKTNGSLRVRRFWSRRRST
jgi:hypothetical protein